MKSTGFHGLPLNAVFFFFHEIQYRYTLNAKYAVCLLVLGSFGMKSAKFHYEIRRIS